MLLLGTVPLPPGVEARAIAVLRQVVGPVSERAFGVFHDVALVHQGDTAAVMRQCVIQRGAHQALRTFARNGLDAEAGGPGKANTRITLREMFLQQFEKAAGFGLSLFEFGARVDVLGVLAKDHHVHGARVANRRGHAFEPAHRPQADIQVEHLADGHVERPDPAADGRCQRSLNGNQVFPEGLDGLVGQPGIESLLGRLARIGFHPHQLPLPSVGGRNRGVQYAFRGPPDIRAGAVSADEGNDGTVRHDKSGAVHGDLFALFRDLHSAFPYFLCPMRGHYPRQPPRRQPWPGFSAHLATGPFVFTRSIGCTLRDQ